MMFDVILIDSEYSYVVCIDIPYLMSNLNDTYFL